MARSYSRITSTIWRDADFVALPPEQKLAYLMLISQPDVSPCGVLSVTLRRWGTSLGITTDELSDALEGLSKSRFIIWDEDAEEVLIRSFVKWDGGLGNENRTKAIIAAADSIRSAKLYNATLAEMDRLGASHGLNRRETDPVQCLPTPFEPASKAVGTPFEPPRVVVTLGESLEPQPLNLEPTRSEPREPDRFPDFWSAYPLKKSKQAAKRRWDTLIKRGTDPAEIIAGANSYAAEVRDVEARFMKHPDGWLNAGRWEDEPTRTPTRPSTPWAGS